MKNRILTCFISAILTITSIGSHAVSADNSALQEPQNIQSQESTPDTEEFSLYDIPVAFDDPFEPERKEIKFSEVVGMRYEGIEEFEKAVARMEEACAEEDALPELKELYEFLYNEMVEVNTTSAIAKIEYDVDYRNEELAAQSVEEDTALKNMAILYEEAVKKVLASPYGEDFAEFIGQDVAKGFSDELTDAERAEELSTRETELVMEYYQALQQDYTVEINGEEWNESKLNEFSDDFSDEEYYKFLDAILEKKNAACVPAYLELVQIRKEKASLYGYQNVAEYFYEEVYSRDYSPAEVQNFYVLVKEYIVPAYQAIRDTKAYRSDAVVKKEDVFPVMEEIMPRISEEMSEIFHYMIEHEMIYLAEDYDTSTNTGYSTSLSGMAQPFVYNFFTGDAQGLSDTFHEFGHYCDYYLNGIFGVSDSGIHFDLSEVCSMGLEMLLYQYYDEMIDGDVTDEKLEKLYNFLGYIIDGCMYDEAQQKVFACEEELTAEIVNDIFRKAAAEYGKSSSYDRGFTWVEIIHTFEVPFYYISYAAAASAAMEIWLIAKEQGQDAAIEVYLEILSRGSFEYGYAEVLEACGMQGFQSEEYIEKLSSAIIAETETLLANKENVAE